MNLKDKIDKNRLPKHIAVIMDGNGRWAKKKGNQRIFGHRNGVKAVRETVEACAELQVSYLTLYAFSTENWNRPKSEVDALMSLLVKAINDEIDNMMENQVRLLCIGDHSRIPPDVKKKLDQAIQTTKNNTGLTTVLALSYSSRWEIVEAARRIARDAKDNRLDPDTLTADIFSDYLNTAGMPDPELMIRTSGEYRISNYLLWQIAYAELHFTDVLWPDFRRDDLYKAILDFQGRERRFGKTSEQL